MLKRGFTLVEMIVAVGIFAIVMTVSLGALLVISQSERQAETLKSVMDNLNFSLDSMSRSIRTGHDYHCGSLAGGDCSSAGSSYFAFTDVSGAQAVYCLGASSCGDGGAAVLRSLGGGPFVAMTSQDVVVQSLTFYLIGSAQGSPDATQPKVTILMRGHVQVTGTQQTSFNLETSVTQRIYDQ